MASGLPMPVGFKNSTDGSLAAALNAIRAAGSPQTFPGIDQRGRTGIVRTGGNPWGHLVLRGGESPNYHAENIEDIRCLLRAQGLSEVLLVDCSHGNSRKDHRRQPVVCRSVLRQRLDGDDAIVGLMLESNLREGRQPLGTHPSALAYGVSITDACMGWDETENLLWETHARLMDSPAVRRKSAQNLSAVDEQPVTSQRM
jgi:3-deoxy-7-phosphoheptulonate synthase